jgi:hypothetical protein
MVVFAAFAISLETLLHPLLVYTRRLASVAKMSLAKIA